MRLLKVDAAKGAAFLGAHYIMAGIPDDHPHVLRGFGTSEGCQIHLASVATRNIDLASPPVDRPQLIAGPVDIPYYSGSTS